jgi:hypothetical protein
MDAWEWVREFHTRAAEAGDEQRLRLCELYGEAYDCREENPDRALALCAEGARLSRLLVEPWWLLFYEHRHSMVQRLYKRDYRDLLDHAVQNTLDLRKPGFEQFPWRFTVLDNLVACYIGIDPLGYHDAIEDALLQLEHDAVSVGDRYLIQNTRHHFYVELDHFDLAEEWALRILSMADSEPDQGLAEHHSTFAYSALCLGAGVRQQWDRLDGWVREGERLARRRELQRELCEFLGWQAVLAHRSGDEERARYLFRRATTRMGRLQLVACRYFNDPVCTFHELHGDLEAALAVREHELEGIGGKGQFGYESRLRIQIADLRRRLGVPFDVALEAARQVVVSLKAPGVYLEKIDAVTRGESPAFW